MKKNLNKYIFFLSLILIGIGLSRGEASVILQKAIYICLECIGIG